MITKENFKKVLKKLGFTENKHIYIKPFPEFDCEIKVDFKNEKFEYPNDIEFDGEFTLNFHQKESFVVLECVHNLLVKGYHPRHIELEKTFSKQKKEDGGGRADIIVKNNDGNILLIIECKTAGDEFKKHWQKTLQDGDQLFRYLTNKRETQFLCMYTVDFIDETIIHTYNLISLLDNQEYLNNNPKLESFQIAKTKNKEDIFKVWVETYGQEYYSKGLFEKEIAPYKIGKTKFTSEDLKNINSKDIQGKYHEFATILRQHNVSGRENAFDKLVNLFLCKVTDETTNKDELKFYWKGRAYDNPFDFQDRLQQLYKNGMEKFLGENITYIDNNQIDEAFDVFKNKPNSTKEQIKNYFRELKFFTNNDFAFIDVHNEKLFYQNFEVLLKIARMIQDISLTSSDENQFLGDMFEGFLDQGVKQSEGQFFTPMPIVKFIINSLPNKENPNVIDYACGAGHFLNEYASSNKTAKITGIEKEYRLSKVAKVSSFMYGSDINIIYDDALSSNEKIKNSSFDVLIANPPYSVKGFLETLKDEDRAKYELTSTIEEKSYQANNSIECFFMEKSKQLLKANGVAGIIVPSSILNKGSQSIGTNKANVYVTTREIILKYFDIVAIAEFGSGTFGKTGTNTVTLFLKRKSTNLDISQHLKNMVDSWFECDFETNKVFEDSELLKEYCKHLNYDFNIYKTLLCENLDVKLFDYEMFKEYKTEFEKLTDTKNRRKTKTYIALQETQKNEIEHKELIKFIRAIEKDKLYYFCIAYKNSCEVVIVKSPSDGKENKKFLGYEWSSAKGNEGIHYLSSTAINIEDESLDEEDKRILENLSGLKHINTPLYNPQNSDDQTKINKIIKDNFQGIKTIIPIELETYVNRAKLVDMIDFTRVDFNKAIGLSINKKVEIHSKWELVKIENIVSNIINGSTPSKSENSYWNNNDINWLTTPDFNDEKLYIVNTSQFVSKKALEDKKVTIVPKNSVLITCTATIGKIGVNKIDLTTNQQINALICINEEIIPEFLAYFMTTQKENLENLTSNSGVKHINLGMLKNFKIPLPPLDIQEQIAKECQKVDNEVSKANETIDQTKKEIENEINSVDGEITKLGEIFILQNGKAMPKNKMIDGNIPVYGGNGIMGYHNESLIDYPTISIGRVGEYCGAVHITESKSWISDNSMFVTKFIKDIDLKFIYFSLVKLNLNQFANKASQPNISQPIILSKSIPLPSLETQKQIVSKIEKLETIINEAKKIVASAKEKKEEILKNYL